MIVHGDFSGFLLNIIVLAESPERHLVNIMFLFVERERIKECKFIFGYERGFWGHCVHLHHVVIGIVFLLKCFESFAFFVK